jgi:DNA polymerase III delta prime subunit
MLGTEFLWVEKYRPKTIDDTVLPASLKSTFQQFVNNENIPNLILSGPAGVGKTTVARAMLEELGCDYIVINGSLDRNIDTLRNEIMNFASSVSLTGGRKYVILDEADYLNPNSTQPALRSFMEEFSKNCGFIFTCNYKNRIIEPLHSRCSVIDFKISKLDIAKLASQFYKRLIMILENEHIKYESTVLIELVTKYVPDWRRILNEVQRYSVSGVIDTGILANIKEISAKELMGMLKEKKFSELRVWVGENSDMDQNEVFRLLYDNASTFLTKETVPALILIIGRYQYQAAFVADQEINLIACLVEIMMEVEFTS